MHATSHHIINIPQLIMQLHHIMPHHTIPYIYVYKSKKYISNHTSSSCHVISHSPSCINSSCSNI